DRPAGRPAPGGHRRRRRRRGRRAVRGGRGQRAAPAGHRRRRPGPRQRAGRRVGGRLPAGAPVAHGRPPGVRGGGAAGRLGRRPGGPLGPGRGAHPGAAAGSRLVGGAVRRRRGRAGPAARGRAAGRPRGRGGLAPDRRRPRAGPGRGAGGRGGVGSQAPVVPFPGPGGPDPEAGGAARPLRRGRPPPGGRPPARAGGGGDGLRRPVAPPPGGGRVHRRDAARRRGGAVAGRRRRGLGRPPRAGHGVSARGPARAQNRCVVWLKVPLPKASTFVGVTDQTWASPPSGWWKAPFRTSKSQRPSHVARHASASRARVASSVVRSARPSTTTSSPSSHRLHPVVRTTCGLAARFRAFCSSGPVQKWTAPSSHTATSGVTCGRPSARTVVSQDTPALRRTATASSQVVAVASGSLNRGSSLVLVGAVMGSRVPPRTGGCAAVVGGSSPGGTVAGGVAHRSGETPVPRPGRRPV